ncbi:oligosaccharide flippase family protein, partial [Lactobacillus acidophilus]|uniref:oligosaccharide flippase family protein n=1 Tax=Lactobacillus acidophilus TaxID=1579 RepID=UPI003F536643
NFSSTYVSYFILIAELGVGTYAVREGAKYRNRPKILNRFVDEVFTINVLATIMSYLLLFSSLIIFANLRTYFSCILVFSIQIIFTTIGTEWIYNIFEDYAYITFRSIAFQILSVILLFVCVRQKSDFLIYAAITVLSTVGSNIINFFYARKFCKV